MDRFNRWALNRVFALTQFVITSTHLHAVSKEQGIPFEHAEQAASGRGFRVAYGERLPRYMAGMLKKKCHLKKRAASTAIEPCRPEPIVFPSGIGILVILLLTVGVALGIMVGMCPSPPAASQGPPRAWILSKVG